VGGAGGAAPPTVASKSSASADVLAGGSYRIHLQSKATQQWYELQDLHVQETMPQLVGLSESYLLIYEKKSVI